LTRTFTDRQGQQWAYIRRSDKPNTKLAIFVHGFRGNYLTTWGKLPWLFKEEADSSEILSDWDFVFLGYSTMHITTYLDIAELIDAEWEKACSGHAPYGGKYTELALFGHSLGTLGIRQFLCTTHQSKTFLSRVVLFGSPLYGSPLAIIPKFYRVAAALETGNAQIRMLRKWTNKAFEHDPWTSVNLFVGSKDMVVVGNDFVDWVGDTKAQVTNHSHLDMLNIKDFNCAAIDLMLTALK